MAATKRVTLEHRVAVYGSLKAGRHNHGYLRKARLIGRYQTAAEYTMIDLGAYPAIIPNGNTAIEVEIYRVDAATLEALDKLEEHPDCYRRVLVKIANMDAYLYVLTEREIRRIKNIRDRIVRSGRW
ncbi:MAG: gamma-glutamylcyclotransferase family protein [Gammaproteobacteria bacterium]